MAHPRDQREPVESVRREHASSSGSELSTPAWRPARDGALRATSQSSHPTRATCAPSGQTGSTGRRDERDLRDEWPDPGDHWPGALGSLNAQESSASDGSLTLQTRVLVNSYVTFDWAAGSTPLRDDAVIDQDSPTRGISRSYKVLRFWLTRRCSSPLLDRINGDLPYGTSLAVGGDALIHGPSLVARSVGSEWRTRRPYRQCI